MNKNPQSTTERLTVLGQFCKLIPKHSRSKVCSALDLISFIPTRVVTDSENHHDGSYMSELCGNMKSGNIAVMDRAYVDYAQLNTLTEKGVFWVTRSKSNTKLTVIEERDKGERNEQGESKHYPIILSDDVVVLAAKTSHAHYPRSFRRVEAKVPDSKGAEIKVSFLSNNPEWAASSICDLYRCRWGIETFFKEIKQTLQIRTFVGFSRNAIEWQI